MGNDRNFGLMQFQERLVFSDVQPVVTLRLILEQKLPPELSDLFFEEKALQLWSSRVASGSVTIYFLSIFTSNQNAFFQLLKEIIE